MERNFRYVKINYRNLDEVIKKINVKNLKYWLQNNPYNLFDLDISLIINFMLIFEAIDYSFFGEVKWKIDTEFGVKDGSDALFLVLLNYVKKNNSTDFSELTFLSFKELFKGNGELPLLEERYNTVVEVSKIVNEKMNGNFYEYIYDVKSDIELFEIIITNFPSFTDERWYDGKKIYFYKLAQLLVSDILHLRQIIEKIDVDYSHLVGCADYKIPQTMRALEIIEYNDDLAKLVDNKKELEASSRYEVEIRASVIVVINYIKEKLPEAKAIDINDYFFLLARDVKDIARPYHLCRNVNY